MTLDPNCAVFWWLVLNKAGRALRVENLLQGRVTAWMTPNDSTRLNEGRSMNGRMEKSYFEERSALRGALSAAIAKSQEVQSLIESTRYEMPNLTDPSAIHEIARQHKCTSDLPAAITRKPVGRCNHRT